MIFQVPYSSPDLRPPMRRMLRELVVVEEGHTDEPFGAWHQLARSLLGAAPRLHQRVRRRSPMAKP